MSLNSIGVVHGVDLKLFTLILLIYCLRAYLGILLELAIKNFLICSI